MKKTGYKESFIFIIGTTPQIITETIYYLGVVNKPHITPDEIFIITTETGRNIVKSSLVAKGILKKLEDEHNLPEVPLSESSFLIPVDEAGSPLNDILDAHDNLVMGDFISSFIKKKSEDQSVRMHCSLAGGRKTMAFYLGSAMQMFGRSCDKLYHVLVTPEFESCSEFYYKPKTSKILTFSGKRINSGAATITLTELPFIRLRNKLALESSSFTDLIKEGQQEIDTAIFQPELKVILSERSLTIGSKTIKLPPLHLMIYCAYLKYKIYRCKYPERQYCADCTECFPSLLELATKTALEEMAKDYMKICPSKVSDFLHKNKDGLSVESIRQVTSKIRKAITEQLGDEALALYYTITTSVRQYANSRHGVRAEKGKIRIE